MTEDREELHIAPDLDERLCQVLIGWHCLENNGSTPPIIDFDVSGVASASNFDHRYDVLLALQELKGACDPRSFAFERVCGHEAYLRVLMGQQIPFDDYVKATQGVLPRLFSDDYLEQARATAQHRLAVVGIEASGSIRDQLKELDPPLDVTRVERTFRALLEEHFGSLETIVAENVRFNLEIEFVEVDEYWSYWVDGEKDRFRLRLNKSRAVFSSSECLQFAFHELLSHCGQMQAWSTLISQGRLARYFGITTVHTPEQFMSEGLAQMLPLLVSSPAKDDELLIARMALMRYELLVQNNLHYMVNHGASLEDCLMRYNERSLQPNTRAMLTDLASRGTNPLYRTYQYVYPVSCELFWRAAEKLSSCGRAELVKFCFRGPGSAATLDALVASLEPR